MKVDRRALLAAGIAGPGLLLASCSRAGAGFSHGVASGEPGPDSMLLWTRYVPNGRGDVTLQAQIALDDGFSHIVAQAPVSTGRDRDFTAKVTLGGLEPATRYHYRFVAPDGAISPIGKTRTLPVGDVDRFGIAIFSCANIGRGYFNAYAHAAARDDIALAVHLGDYIYEDPRGQNPTLDKVVDNRLPDPAKELVTLEDYRARYACYRRDPDLQALHAAMPMVIQWDDHEFSDNAWADGSTRFYGGKDLWAVRKHAAIQAFREWLPVSDDLWRDYRIGALATLFKTDGRSMRDELARLPLYLRQRNPIEKIERYRDTTWRDPRRTMLGHRQAAWLASSIAASATDGAAWQLLASGTVMGKTRMPPSAIAWKDKGAWPSDREAIEAGVLFNKLGLPLAQDNWGGYPAERDRLLAASQRAGANLIVVSGDSHNAWAYDLENGDLPAGVEFAGHSVNSWGFEQRFAVPPAETAAAFLAHNPELKWCALEGRGYMALSLTPEHATNEWVFVDTIRKRSLKTEVRHRATVIRGSNRMEQI